MGFPTKVQLIKRKQSEQWYINFPSAVAQAMEFEKGEMVEWIVENKGLLALKRAKVPPNVLKKKTGGITEEFDKLFDETRPAFAQERTFLRAKRLALSAVVGLGRRTVSGMLCTSAQQFVDWSAAYRLFDKGRFCRQTLFAPVRRAVVELLSPEHPLVVMMDDTLIRKCGRKVHGTGWKRDPLGPPFCTNFVWGQRFLQVSAALPDADGTGRARAVPIELIHAPSAKKPGKKAPPEQWEEYRKLQEATKVSTLGAAQLHALRQNLDADAQNRHVIAAVDGGFTNRTVFRNLPDKTILIGRIRKDAKLYSVPEADVTPRRGRRKWYGEPLPAPEHIRQDESIPWTQVNAFAAGTRHTFEIKTISAARWAGTGDRTVRVVIVRPLAYRPRKGAKLLYRNPAYLICTDPNLPLEQLLQAYLWRWEVEVNFRDQKTLFGVGEAQVRNHKAVEAVPALITAAYAMLLLAGSGIVAPANTLPRPKWQRRNAGKRCSTQQLIGLFRTQLWGKALGVNLQHFANADSVDAKSDFFQNSLQSAVCYAAK